MGIWDKEIADEVKKQLWVAGPMICVCVCQYSLQMMSLMFVGHLDELLLAGASLATSFVNVTGFNVLMGMSSALDTFCGQGSITWLACTHKEPCWFSSLSLYLSPLFGLEAWTFEIMVLLSGALPNAKLQTSVLSICLNTTGIFWMVPFEVSAAGSTRISNELGAGRAKAAYLAVKVTMFLASAVGILEFAALLLVRRVWGRAFTNVHEVVTYVTSMIPIVASSAFIDSIQTAFQGVARGCGWQKLGAFFNLGSYYFLGVPFAIVTAFVLHMKGQGLLLGIVLALIVQVVCFLVVTLRTNWEKEANKAATRVGGSIVQVEALQGNQNANTA
ncbi:hypothetical protein JHK82_018038 [Glycine max]|nr:hypothetical protein JHK82_018038 [Glycine max]